MAIPEQVQELLATRRTAYWNPEPFRNARQALLARDRDEVLAHFQSRLQRPDEDERALAVEGLALLYGTEAGDTIVRWIKDPSRVVRWKVCGCLHDFGDVRAAPALLDRMKNDDDCQVRGMAVHALGQIGSLEYLPNLYEVQQTDTETDCHGHSPSSTARDAMTCVLRGRASRRIQGDPPRIFREATTTGKLTGVVTAEAISLDEETPIHQSSRYSHVPQSAFGHGWSSWIDLQTSLTAPFEIEVEYTDPTCVIGRILIYEEIRDSDETNWFVHTILDPTAMKPRPSP